MTGTHLSDQELQTYLTEKNSCSKELLEHVHSCAHCQMAAAVYKQLFVAIKNDAAPGFDFDVAEMVLQKITGSEKKSWMSTLLISVFALICLGIPAWWYKKSILSMFSGMFPMTIYLLLSGAIIILLFQGLDMYRKYIKIVNAVN